MRGKCNNVNDLNINDISNIILQDLLTAYDGHKFSVSDKLSDNPIVYTGCTKSKELICFMHDKDTPLKNIIEFLESIEGNNISDIKNIISEKDIQEQLKKCWRENKIIHTSTKSGTIYKTRNNSYIAFIPEKLQAFLN